MTKKKRIMTKFKISEISTVDNPAQKGAKAVIMKRDDDFSKQFKMTSSNEGHSHNIDLHEYALFKRGGYTEYCNEHYHPFVINEDGSITVGYANGHTHTVEEILNFEKTHEENVMSNESLKEQLDALKAEMQKNENALSKAQSDLEKANALAALSDEEKAYLSSLPESDQASFVAKSSDERLSEIKKSQEADAVVYTDGEGNEYRKSDDPRIIALAKKADKDSKALQEQIEKNESLEIAKRAKTEFSNLPGDESTHIAIIKALDGIENEDVRKKAYEVVKSGVTGEAFEEQGSNQYNKSDDATASAQLEDLAKKRAEADGISYTDAYSLVMNEQPELYAKAVQGH